MISGIPCIALIVTIQLVYQWEILRNSFLLLFCFCGVFMGIMVNSIRQDIRDKRERDRAMEEEILNETSLNN